MAEPVTVPVTEQKKRYLDLLLLADEQESMVDRYLERGEMFALLSPEDGRALGVCVLTDEGDGLWELKSLAVAPDVQRRGYGQQLVAFAVTHCRGRGHTLQVGTGDVESALGFYRRCGFAESHRLPGFFTDHYDRPIYEQGKQLVDMVYLAQPL